MTLPEVPPTVDPDLPLPDAAAQAWALAQVGEEEERAQAEEQLIVDARARAAEVLAPVTLDTAEVVLTRLGDGLVVLRCDGVTLSVHPEAGEVRVVTVLDGEVERRSEPLRSLADLGAELGRG